MVEHFAAVKARRAQCGHVGPLKDRGSTRTKFDAAILALIDKRPRTGATGLRDGRRKAMLAALDGEATYHQIKDWRRGKSKPPQWAVDKINTKLADRCRQLDAALEAIRAA